MTVNELKEYAVSSSIPIMQDDSIEYINTVIKNKNIKNILEIGTAIGYSAINFAYNNENIKITSIERDEKRYKEAVKNIKLFNFKERIELKYGDALDIELKNTFDLIIIDAAKGKNIDFFKHFKSNLNDKGIIIIDNINFHGLVGKSSEIKSKNLRSLVRKIESSIEYLKVLKDFKVKFIDIGDGLAICERIN